LPNRGNLQDRRGNLENRLGQRDNLQDRRQDVREDWQDRYNNFYDRHDDWHHGCWNGNASDWWNHMWDEHTALMAFGTTMWGLNRAAYAFGYWGYSNPYYTEPYPIAQGYAVDYSQPIAVEEPATATTTTPTAEPPAAMTDFDQARELFYKKDYQAALAATNKALVGLPNDPIIHEFRALVQFALGNYREAAAGLYSVLAVGPGWDWTTMSSLYPDATTYTAQLRKLEEYVTQNPKANDARFVLGYHYLTAGYKDPTITQWQIVYKANPNDQLMKQLLLMVGGSEAIGVAPTAEAAQPDAAVKIPKENVLGQWVSTDRGSIYTLVLSQDGNFKWKYAKGNQIQAVSGVFALDGDVLALEPETGGTMLAQIKPPKNGSLDFKMLGAPPGDTGLKFTKTP